MCRGHGGGVFSEGRNKPRVTSSISLEADDASRGLSFLRPWALVGHGGGVFSEQVVSTAASKA